MDTDTRTVVLIVVFVALLLLVVGLLLDARRRRRRLQRQFGPEYDRTVGRAGSRRDAQRELRDRVERREQIELRELPAAHRRRFESRWQEVQEDFVDRPDAAVDSAQALVTEVMRERGYPVDDPDVVSVDHADVMGDYRTATRISAMNERGEATTEQLRQALVHYRSLFARLLGTPGDRAAHDPYPQEQPGRSRERH